MQKKQFQSLLTMAKTFYEIDSERSDFWRGFQRGLRRLYHGENFVTDEEHEQCINCARGEYRKQLQTGYRAGFYRDQYRLDSQQDLHPLRKLLKLNTADIGDIAAVSPRTVEGWEQGRSMPDSALQLIRNHLML